VRADDLIIEQTHFAAAHLRAHLVREWHLADAITVLGDIRFGVRRKLDHLEDEYMLQSSTIRGFIRGTPERPRYPIEPQDY
jgi:hypothetical protein